MTGREDSAPDVVRFGLTPLYLGFEEARAVAREVLAERPAQAAA